MTAHHLKINSTEWATLKFQEWDSQILERKCATVAEMSSLTAQQTLPTNHYSSIIEMCKTQGWEYLTVRRPQSEWARIQALEAAGFHTVDGILELSRKIDVLSSSGSGVTSPYRFRLAEKTDADAVAALSAKSFHLSRFHNDPLITRAQADRVHFEWGRNSCLGLAADGVWLVEREGILCGFITGKIKDKTGSIVLITVDPQEAGRGVGLALVQKACAWFSERGCLEARVPTQTNNFAALRLYTRAGFETVAASVTLRWSATK